MPTLRKLQFDDPLPPRYDVYSEKRKRAADKDGIDDGDRRSDDRSDDNNKQQEEEEGRDYGDDSNQGPARKKAKLQHQTNSASTTDRQNEDFDVISTGVMYTRNHLVEQADKDLMNRDSKRIAKEKKIKAHHRAIDTTKKNRAKKDPNAPKGPKTCYNFFTFDVRLKLEAEGIMGNGDNLNNNVASNRALGDRWRTLSAKERHRYEKMATDDRERFELENEVYEANQSRRRCASDNGGSNGLVPSQTTSTTTADGKNWKDSHAPKQAYGVYLCHQNDPKVPRKNPSLASYDIPGIMSRQWDASTAEERRKDTDSYEKATVAPETAIIRAEEATSRVRVDYGKMKGDGGSSPFEEQSVAVNVSIIIEQRGQQGNSGMETVSSSSTPTKGGDPGKATSNRPNNSTRENAVTRHHGALSAPALAVCERRDELPAMHAAGVATARIASVGIGRNSADASAVAAEKNVDAAEKGSNNAKTVNSQAATERDHSGNAVTATASAFAAAWEHAGQEIDVAPPASKVARTITTFDMGNESMKENKENGDRDVIKESNNFGGFGKRMVAMAAKSKVRSPPKKSLKGKKRHRFSVNNVMAELSLLDATKESMANTPLVIEKKCRSKTSKANQNDDTSTASISSCDSVRAKGLNNEGKPCPLKNFDEVGDNYATMIQTDSKVDEGDVVAGNAKKAYGDAPTCDEGEKNGGQPTYRGDEGAEDSTVSMDVSDNINAAKVEGCTVENRDALSTVDNVAKLVSLRDNGNSTAAFSHDGETRVRAKITTAEFNDETAPLGSITSLNPAVKTANVTTAVSSTKLNFIPISKAACQSLFREKRIACTEPGYLIPGSSSKYNISRVVIALETIWTKDVKTNIIQCVSSPSHPTTAVLGRNKTTGIKWSAISRQLCDISLNNGLGKYSPIPTAFVIMRKSADEHAVCLNGCELNIPVGQRVSLRNGDVLSLYGPAGFAYQVELSHEGGESNTDSQTKE